MIKVIGILFLSILLLFQSVNAQSITEIRKEKEKSEKEISYLNKLLNETQNSRSVSLEKLDILQQKILQTKRLINSLNGEVKYLQSNIETNKKRIEELQEDKKAMLALYAKLVYGTWKKRNKTNKLMFILSSTDFNQAYNRFKYFQQIQEYSKRQLRLVEQVNDSLNQKNKDLNVLVERKNATLNSIGVQNKELQSEQVKEDRYIAELRKKEKEIKKKLEVQERNRKRLASELSKLIARQNKKSGSSSNTYKLTPEEKLVSDDFAKNKGKLPWPVTEGFISEKFGIHVHPIHKQIRMENGGVNITTSKGAGVRSVFNGEVSEILLMPGFNNVVIIRHGSYLSVYSNLVEVVVVKGQKIKTKDLIGKVAFDAEKGSVLHFEVWKDINKLDPELWLAK